MKNPLIQTRAFNTMLVFYRHGSMGSKLLSDAAVQMLRHITFVASSYQYNYITAKHFSAERRESTTTKRCLRFLKSVGFLKVLQTKQPKISAYNAFQETSVVYQYQDSLDSRQLVECFKTLSLLRTARHKQTLFPMLLLLLCRRDMTLTYSHFAQLLNNNHTGLQKPSAETVRRAVKTEGNQVFFTEATLAVIRGPLSEGVVNLSGEGFAVARALLTLYQILSTHPDRDSFQFEQTGFKFLPQTTVVKARKAIPCA